MKKNEYDAAEVVEMGEAQSVVRGGKTGQQDVDASGMEPLDRHYDSSDASIRGLRTG